MLLDRLTTQRADVAHLWGCGLGLKQGVKGMAVLLAHSLGSSL